MNLDNYNYYGDHRVIASMVSPAYDVVSVNQYETTVRLHDSVVEDLQCDHPHAYSEDWDGEVTAPTRAEVCDQCNGAGRTTNPSIDAGGLTNEDFYDDPDFAEDYFGGVYDVTCSQCGGKGLLYVPEFGREVQRAIDNFNEAEEAYAAERAAELRYGC